jgi:MYND finger
MSKPRRHALSEAGRALAAARSVVGPIQCEVCGKEVIATTAGRYKRRYCSRACQARAYRQAHQEEINAYRRERYRRQRAQ